MLLGGGVLSACLKRQTGFRPKDCNSGLGFDQGRSQKREKLTAVEMLETANSWAL